MIKIILKRNREESLLRFHPWVFSGAIAEIQGNPAEGDLVAVHACDGSFLAYGHYQIGSIAVRVFMVLLIRTATALYTAKAITSQALSSTTTTACV